MSKKTKATKEKTCTIIVWNDKQVRIRYCSELDALRYSEDLRELMHGKGEDDPRWQIVDGKLEVDGHEEF